jgi:hypothetical protein
VPWEVTPPIRDVFNKASICCDPPGLDGLGDVYARTIQ